MIARNALVLSDIAADVAEGLSREPKSLPPRLFYDAAGSELFEAITELPEYYLTRCERAIFEAQASAIASLLPPNVRVVELGAGSATKTGIILQAILRRQLRVDYYPVDVSHAALAQAEQSLTNSELAVHAIVANYVAETGFIAQVPGQKLVMYIGSSIGNFDPPDAEAILNRVRSQLNSGDMLLVGVDLVKPLPILLAAYDDAQGVTAAFNKNMLARINRELGASFVVDQFRHVALWNASESRMEMYLESTTDQLVAIPALGRTYAFLERERIHTENSYKFTEEVVDALLARTGFAPVQRWNDTKNWFSVRLAVVP